MSTFGGDIRITVSQLRTHMHRVVREAERGQTFTITRAGRIVARVVATSQDRVAEAPLPPDLR